MNNKIAVFNLLVRRTYTIISNSFPIALRYICSYIESPSSTTKHQSAAYWNHFFFPPIISINSIRDVFGGCVFRLIRVVIGEGINTRFFPTRTRVRKSVRETVFYFVLFFFLRRRKKNLSKNPLVENKKLAFSSPRLRVLALRLFLVQ